MQAVHLLHVHPAQDEVTEKLAIFSMASLLDIEGPRSMGVPLVAM